MKNLTDTAVVIALLVLLVAMAAAYASLAVYCFLRLISL